MTKLSQRNTVVVALVLLTAIAVGVGLLIDNHRNSTTLDRSAAQPAAAIEQPELPQFDTLAVIGDSYSVPNTLSDHWPKLLGFSHRWSVRDFAAGGTGYVQSNDKKGKFSFLRQLDQVVAVQPDILVVAGGRNDVSHPNEVGPAAREMYGRIIDELPDTKVLIVGPLVGSDPPTETAWKVNRELQSAANDAGLPYVDAMGERWLTDPLLLKDDRAHPNTAGHQRIFENIDRRLQALEG